MFWVTHKILMRSGVLAAGFLLSGATSALADHYPYYFVDSGNSKRGLYVTSNCGHGIDCENFGTYCDAHFFSSPKTKSAGKNMIDRGENIYIRENSSPYDVVCTLFRE